MCFEVQGRVKSLSRLEDNFNNNGLCVLTVETEEGTEAVVNIPFKVGVSNFVLDVYREALVGAEN